MRTFLTELHGQSRADGLDGGEGDSGDVGGGFGVYGRLAAEADGLEEGG